jgi:putative DNA primase/helicase
MASVDAREVGDIAYMLANGVGKERMNKSTAVRKPFSWSLLFLSSGEISLADRMSTAGKRIRGGQQARLVDLGADAVREWEFSTAFMIHHRPTCLHVG